MTLTRNVWAICLRELGSYFLAPMAYVVIFLFLVTNGTIFWLSAKSFTNRPPEISTMLEDLFGFALFWIIPLSPLLTMRLFAEEKRTGTLEMLMTAPVTESQVVLGKFLAAQVFYMLIWLSLGPLLAVLAVLGRPDWGPIISIYLGTFALGLLTNSLGVLASATTRNQLVAAVLALTGNLLFFLVNLLRALFPDEPDFRRLISYISFSAHFGGDYINGVLDLRYFLFYLSFALFFLFFSVRLLEARKWR
jgi:ABC-2 type transport system permease protein